MIRKPVGLELKLQQVRQPEQNGSKALTPTLSPQGRAKLKRGRAGFTLLEVVIVLFIVALVLAAVHSIAQGAVTLADDVRRAQRRDARQQAFTTFGERLFAELPPTAALNVKTTQKGGQYLSGVELHGVPSPFDGMPDMVVSLFTESLPGGGMRLLLSCRKIKQAQAFVTVMLFDDLAACEWRVYNPASRHWTTQWQELREGNTSQVHPTMVELVTTTTAGERKRHVFWIAPNTSVGLVTVPPLTGTPPPAQAIPP